MRGRVTGYGPGPPWRPAPGDQAEWGRGAWAGSSRSTDVTRVPGVLDSIAVIALATAAAKPGASRSKMARCTPAERVSSAPGLAEPDVLGQGGHDRVERPVWQDLHRRGHQVLLDPPDQISAGPCGQAPQLIAREVPVGQRQHRGGERGQRPPRGCGGIQRCGHRRTRRFCHTPRRPPARTRPAWWQPATPNKSQAPVCRGRRPRPAEQPALHGLCSLCGGCCRRRLHGSRGSCEPITGKRYERRGSTTWGEQGA